MDHYCRITLKDTPVFIIHYEAMVDRKKYLSEWFSSRKMSPNWIVEGQREQLTEDVINKYYQFDPQIYDRKLTLGEIGCTIGHLSAYNQVVQRGYDYALILEDDVFFPEDFCDEYDSLMSKYPSDFDVISLGSCCGLKFGSTNEDERFYRVIPARGRCGYAQLMSKKACELSIKYSSPFHYPADWQFLFIASNNPEHQFVTYWVEPPIAIEGSKSNKYASSIR